jgi:hypothetical protein
MPKMKMAEILNVMRHLYLVGLLGLFFCKKNLRTNHHGAAVWDEDADSNSELLSVARNVCHRQR